MGTGAGTEPVKRQETPTSSSKPQAASTGAERVPAARVSAGRAPAEGAAGKTSKAKRPRRARESLIERQARFARILPLLHDLYPDADCALEHRGAFELLIATILSAQSTDETVNKVTPVLFARYPTPAALAEAPLQDLESIIHSTGFFRQKARSLKGAAQRIVEVYGGRPPDTLEELVTLPGVARKTANVVLGTHFHKNQGVVVDTHVGRLAVRLGLTWSARDAKDAVRIEQDLMQIIPRDEWTYCAHALIWHGRRICSARKPACTRCLLSPMCPAAFKFD